MQDDEIKRNQNSVTFQPCSVCRTERALNIEQKNAPEKIKKFHITEKNIQNYLFVKAD
jgi:hypothetical protein